MAIASIINGIFTFWESLYQFLFYTWPFILLITLFILRKRWKRYPLEAVILEKRGENLLKTNDRVGKFEDKNADMTYYRFWKTKETMPVYNFDWVLHSRPVNTNFLEKLINLIRPTIGTIFLFKYGSRQYKPISVSQNPDKKVKLKEVKGENGETLYTYQYAQFDPRWVVGALDFDVIDWDNMNFMVQEQRASVMRRSRKGEKLLAFVIPITILIVTLLISIFILKFSADAGASLRGGGGTQSDGGNGGSKILGGIQNVFTPGA